VSFDLAILAPSIDLALLHDDSKNRTALGAIANRSSVFEICSGQAMQGFDPSRISSRSKSPVSSDAMKARPHQNAAVLGESLREF